MSCAPMSAPASRTLVLQKDQRDDRGTRLNPMEAALERLAEHGQKLGEWIGKLVSAIGVLVRHTNPGLGSLQCRIIYSVIKNLSPLQRLY